LYHIKGGNPAYPGSILTWHWVVLQNRISCLTSAQFHDVKRASHDLCLRQHCITICGCSSRFGHSAKQSSHLFCHHSNLSSHPSQRAYHPPHRVCRASLYTWVLMPVHWQSTEAMSFTSLCQWPFARSSDGFESLELELLDMACCNKLDWTMWK